jgi:hypothetical protein
LTTPGYALEAYNSTGDYWYYHSEPSVSREILDRAHPKQSLGKRAFEKLNGRITASKIDTYVKNQLVGTRDPQFPDVPAGFFAGAMQTVSLLGQFGTDKIQYGTNQLHGCTIMTINSNRAVYMVGAERELVRLLAKLICPAEPGSLLGDLNGAAVTNPTNPTDPRFASLRTMAPECKWKQQPFVFSTPDMLTRMFSCLSSEMDSVQSTRRQHPGFFHDAPGRHCYG